MKAVVTSINLEQDADVSHTRRTARLIAKVAGAPARDQIRFATAVSEISRNALQYAKGGVTEFAFDRSSKITRLMARVQDKGGGIAAVETMLRGRHQSHTGLGLGLSGSQKLVDDFDLKTGSGGTVITLGLQLSTTKRPEELAVATASALVEASHGSPMEELAEQNRALRDSLAEQQFLLRELHHRTKNNLAIIQSLAIMQARQATTEETQDALSVLTNRIQAFANAHNFLHRAEDVTQVDLQQHLESLTDRLASAMGDHQLTITCKVDAVPVAFDTATELALIVNELVTNVTKHAMQAGQTKGRVTIEAHQSDGTLHLRIADDGEGLADAETVLRNSKSLGWRIVEGCVRKLNGTIDVDGSDGLAISLTFPI
ncbi:putative signal transduction histidine kinase [Aurantimonas manganoxydans SI85-9A1]|uniref:histidine kinase n=1 Tax=Aurantimonas manganoxydans (strain ATCC BAA-1229 / DSM 21871 / SI85-9A1) TaxID=287752 RepID=Q1YEZ2_AURMS|nr:ATP-binding protein [Aurantimonas manganoxydans]EAS48753.1 putative signal transduction histidine kinase [Aurantimonas manganoxydans SI85-9A1]